MKKTLGRILRFLLLQKRFFRRKLYLALLLAAPILVFAMRLAANEKAGILHVAVCQTGEDPEGSGALAKTLCSLDGVVRYTEVSSREEGEELVRQKEADGLLILPPSLEEAIDGFLRGRKGAIGLFVRSDTVTTRLIREQVYGYLQPLLVERTALRFLGKQDIFKDIAPEALKEEYRALAAKRNFPNIFRISFIDNTDYNPDAANYLTSPLRGLLAVYLLLFAIASALFYLADVKDGIFAWTPYARQPLFPLTYILGGTIPGAAAVLLGLVLSGSFTAVPRELLLIVLYTISCAAFAAILLALLTDIRVLGASIPILLMISIVIAPVFVDLRSLSAIQHLHPTFYYLAALHSETILLHGFLYLAVTLTLAGGLLILRRRKL